MSILDADLAAALLKKGLIQKKQLESLITQAKAKKVSLEKMLFERELLSDQKLGAFMAEQYHVPFVRLSDKTIPESLLHLVPFTLASHQYIIPFEKKLNTLNVGINDPDNYELLNDLEKKIGLKINPHYSTEKDIITTLKVYNRDVNEKFTKLLKGAMNDPSKIESLKDAAKIVDVIILFAYQNQASDIHIEPHGEFIIVRYRIDGLLKTIAELPMSILELLVTRIKVLANLRTDEHRAAQDGRFKIDLENNEITLRVSIVPTYDGEKTVLRLLSSTFQDLNLEALGYEDHNLKVIQDNILKTHGIILMTGPTGSGKTTTLYTLLKMLNSPEVNIATIEDPVEYQIDGINQIQVNPKTNLTFGAGLRALLRQDPDIIMVGEIRDEETAGIAVNAALTGHLVLATLHTNDAATTLPRMTEMGVEPFLLAATAELVIAQRLVRKICEKCKQSYEVNADQLATLVGKFTFKQTTVTLYKGVGCEACNKSGFKGRIAIAEVMEVSDAVGDLILTNQSPKKIEAESIKEGMVTLFEDGMNKVLQGKTTLEEVLRVMRS